MDVKGIDYYVKEIAAGIFVINEYNLSTMFVITGEKRALVIDTGTGAADFKGLIKSLTPLPYDVVCTHAHVDHYGGRGQFDRIFLHPDDFSLVKDITVPYKKLYWHLMNIITHGNTIKRRNVKYYNADKEPELVPIREGHVFDLGGRSLRVIELPGHTKGSIGLVSESDRIVFSGDAINPLMLLFLKNAAPLNTYLQSNERLLKDYPDYTVWASHFEAPLNLEQMENNIRLSRELLNRHKMRNSFFPLIAIRAKYKSLIIFKKNKIV